MLAVTVVAIVLLLSLSVANIIRFIAIAPLGYLTAISYLQAKNKFCVQYASTGKQNADEASKSAVAVADEKAVAADKAKAKKMHMQAIGIGIVIATIIAILPL